MRLGDHIPRKLALALRISIGLAGAFFYAGTAQAADCGSGVQLRLSAPAAAQGTLLLVELRSSKPLGEVTGKWNERDVPFWKEREKGQGKASADVRKALIGVDLEKAAGKYEFAVAAELQSGEHVSCQAS